MRAAVYLALLGVCAAQTNRRTSWPDGGTYTVPQGSQLPNRAAAGFGSSGAANAAAGGSLDLILGAPNIGQYANIPESWLLNVPRENLARLRPEVISTLPDSVRARIQQSQSNEALALTALLQSIPEVRFLKMPWAELIKHVPADTLNTLDPQRLTAINWQAAMPNISPEVMYDLTPRTLYFLPPKAWQYVTVKSFQQIDPRALAYMELNSLREIPRKHWDSLNPEYLAALPKDKLAAIDPELLIKASQANPLGNARTKGAGGGSECDDLTLAELTRQLNAGELDPECSARFQKLVRDRVFRQS